MTEAVLHRLTKEASGILTSASIAAEQEAKGCAIHQRHLLQGMLTHPMTQAGRVLQDQGVSLDSVRNLFRRGKPEQHIPTPAIVVYADDAKAVFQRAVEFADVRDAEHRAIMSADLLHALMVLANDEIHRALGHQDATTQSILRALLR